MGSAITTEQIVAAVAVHLSDNLTSSTTVLYPGDTIDPRQHDDWLEWWVTGFERIPQRSGNSDQRRGELDFWIFAKRTTSTYRVMDIVKDLCDQMEHAEISLKNYNVSAETEVGRLRVNEPRRSDVTADFNDPERTDTYAFEVVFPAYAQEV